MIIGSIAVRAAALLLPGDQPGRNEARDLARRELQRREYTAAKPPLTTRLLNYVFDKLTELVNRASGHVPGGTTGLVLLVLLVAGLVAVVVVRLRPSASARGKSALFGAGRELSADEHRTLAEQAAAQGRYPDAVRERLRAVVRELEARGVLDSRPGRTAGEVAKDAGSAVPALTAPLRRGATTFDEVWYGGRVADASSYAVLVEVDRAVTGTKMVVA